MRLLYVYIAGFCLAVAGCSAGDDECTVVDNATSNVSLDYGKGIELAPKLCEVKTPEDVTYAWGLNGDKVSEAPRYKFLACPRFKNTTSDVRVDVKYGAKKGYHAWRVTVRDVAPEYPDCGVGFSPKAAMAALQKGDLYGTATGTDFKSAVACLDKALLLYPCDIELGFWAAYGDLVLFTQHAAASLAVSGVNERTLNSLADDSIDPLLARFDLLADEMPDEFAARPKDFDFAPLAIVDLKVHPGGEWDRGDMLLLDGVFQLVKGGAKFLASYHGSMKFTQLLLAHGVLNASRANLAQVSPIFQEKLIEQLDKDPLFLTLYGGDDGVKRLASAQAAFIRGLTKVNEAITYVKAETDDQKDDKFRYFDCGADALCPPDDSRDSARGDAGEVLLKDQAPYGVYNQETDSFIDRNANGKYDYSYAKTGPDAGEGDFKYGNGETIGTDAFEGLVSRLGVPITPLAQTFMVELAANIKGPNSLDLAKFADVSQDELIQYSIVSGINIPSLRLSRWFEGPRDARDFIPLWSHANKRFFVDTEEEPFDDYGLDGDIDGVEAPAEVSRCTDQILPDFVSADPALDNFSPSRNAGDGCDNDLDGDIDETDGAGRSTDYGTQGNARFDFVDTNGNNKHDAGEAGEPFRDTGLVTFGKPASPAPNNGRWDAVDMAHYWPKGADVGGRPVDIEKDPRNGTLQDNVKPMIDPVYYFFPDAQFNGVLIFEKPTVNADSLPLTDNGELMRFISRLVETGRGLTR